MLKFKLSKLRINADLLNKMIIVIMISKWLDAVATNIKVLNPLSLHILSYIPQQQY